MRFAVWHNNVDRQFGGDAEVALVGIEHREPLALEKLLGSMSPETILRPATRSLVSRDALRP